MKKFLTGILALSLLSIASVAFAQKVGICEQAGYTWSVEQGKCVPSGAEHPCNKDCVYSEEEGKCVCKQTNKMCKGNYVWNETLGECVALTCKTPAVWSDIQQACVIPSVQGKCKNSQVWDAELGQCVNPDEQEESEREELVNVPELKNFILEQTTYLPNEIYFEFVPKGRDDFNLLIRLSSQGGRDILEGWCKGDEAMCKAVGNGRTCSDENYTGDAMWCFKWK